MDFALDDQAPFRLVGVFDRVFDGDDVLGFFVVDFVDEGGESSGFAGAGRAGDEDQAAVEFGETLDYGRDAEF